jgi:N-acetylglucosamine-6-sulfatase
MRRFLPVIVLPLLIVLSACAPAPQRPNFLIIITDDQRLDTVGYMQHTQELIFDQGVEFSNAYVTTPRCCPSRASIFTGQYAHQHGVVENNVVLDETTLIERLHEAGYYTGLVGKYLNSYPRDTADAPLPEFDYWIAFNSGNDDASYVDPILNVNGVVSQETGYQTMILRNYALDFLDQAKMQEAPFFLVFAPYAPHSPSTPAEQDKELFTDVIRPVSPAFNEEDVSDKPGEIKMLEVLDADQIENADYLWLKQLQSLQPVDRAIKRLLEQLAQDGTLDNTVIIFISDNGVSLGEHRIWKSKIFLYEEMSHVPFAIRYPPLIKQPGIEEAVVGNIDIAPTIYEMAGLPVPDDVSGTSLVPLLNGTLDGEWREGLLLEGWTDMSSFAGIHTDRYVYIETQGDRAEFYDLRVDPFQLDNAIDNPDYASIIAHLRELLMQERPHWPDDNRTLLEVNKRR